jgi:thiamine biosynthesis lipoprotein
MRETRIIMGMPITVDIVGSEDRGLHELAFGYFDAIDRRFSTYKPDSEISAINRDELEPAGYSDDMHEVLALAETTRWETDGYFDIRKPDGSIDPSGIVKGWAIRNAARLLKAAGASDFFVDAGGDIESFGRNGDGAEWRVGIRHPFDPQAIVKVIYPRGRGVATSGSYVRGDHIYDPHRPGQAVTDIVSLTVIGGDVLEADRFATAAFAMGEAGIGFVESVPGLEGYSINAAGIATMTSHFEALTQP